MGIDDVHNTLKNGKGKSASATFTPAATSHTGGDCNGAAAEFALVAPAGCQFQITDVSLLIAGATVESTVWTLHLYSVTPPSALADDAVWDIPSGDRASYLGSVSLGTAVDVGASQWVKTSGLTPVFTLTGTSLFGYLVNVTTLTPAAVAHTVTIKGYPV